MRVAVIGSGISGLGSAWLLSRNHEVHLFEKRDRLGGHTHTVVHDVAGRELSLDTGFIVYNETHLSQLLTACSTELGVETQAERHVVLGELCRPRYRVRRRTACAGSSPQPSLLLSADLSEDARRRRPFRAARSSRPRGAGDPHATIARFPRRRTVFGELRPLLPHAHDLGHLVSGTELAATTRAIRCCASSTITDCSRSPASPSGGRWSAAAAATSGR